MEYINKTIEELKQFAEDKRKEYLTADPFPNIYFDNFFIPEKLQEVLDEFPDLKKKADYKFNDKNQIKLASKGEYRFGEKTKRFMHFLNSQTFLEFISTLTGIEDLIPDAYFEGGGCHEIIPGGLLKIHADFNIHPRNKLDRRLNILIYLNKDWDESYGGHFELWDKEVKECKKKILPVFNRMALFSTTSFSYHGHPNPLTCPPDRSRKSLALYYYTNGRPGEEITEALENHNTIFKDRAGTADMEPTWKKAIRLITPPIIINGIKKITNHN